jgi:hypothetical protein
MAKGFSLNRIVTSLSPLAPSRVGVADGIANSEATLIAVIR